MVDIRCPNCRRKVAVAGLKEGWFRVRCKRCGAYVEVVMNQHLQIRLYPREAFLENVTPRRLERRVEYG